MFSERISPVSLSSTLTVRGWKVSAGACGSVVTLRVTLEMCAFPVIGWSAIDGDRLATIDGLFWSEVSMLADQSSGRSSSITNL